MKKILILGFITLCGITAFLLTSLDKVEKMPEPYVSLKDLPMDEQGWFDKNGGLAKLVKEKHPKIAIEVGAWLGSSARYTASNLQEGGKLYAIDTWSGSQAEPQHLQDSRLPYLYQLFLSNVKHANLTDKIIPIRMKSLEAAKALNVKADFIYIDASHEENDVYLDILAWNEHLAPGGTMCGDDYFMVEVNKGVNRAAKVLNKKVVCNDEVFWVFE